MGLSPLETPHTHTQYLHWQHTLTTARSAPSRAGAAPLPALPVRLIPLGGEQKVDLGSSQQSLNHGTIDIYPENVFSARVWPEHKCRQRVRKHLFESGNKGDTVGMNLLAWFY